MSEARFETDVSIIICTRDRCDDLRASLDWFRTLKVPAGWTVELIIVDNGSSDATPDVVRAFRLPSMPVRYLFEASKGKGHALNAGLVAARGRALLFTDDDVHVPSDWVEGMCRPILEGQADAVQGGIRIAPALDRHWMRGVLRTWVAAVEDPHRKPEGLVGANMACSREAMAAVGPFDLRLGPGAAGFFDDTVLGWAIERSGRTILFAPSVAVEHHFDATRLTIRGFMSIARRMARSRAIVERDLHPELSRPSMMHLWRRELPGLAARTVTQGVRYVLNRQPDPGFLARYYRFHLWRERRAA